MTFFCKKCNQTNHTWVLKTRLIEKKYFSKKNGLFLTLGFGTFSARNENLRPLLNRNIPLISGENGLRNHFWPLESVFLMRKSEEKGPNFWGFQLPILRLTFLESSCNLRKFGINKKNGYFFSIRRVFRTHVICITIQTNALKHSRKWWWW